MKKVINSGLAIILFILLIGVAFQISSLFGIIFVVGFIISAVNGSFEKKPLLPLFIFLGGIIIRFAMVFFLPKVIESKNYIDLGIFAVMLVLLFYVGFRVRKGKI